MAFSLMLVFYNFKAGLSGLMALDDVYYAFFNTCMTTIAMGFIFLANSMVYYGLSLNVGSLGDPSI